MLYRTSALPYPPSEHNNDNRIRNNHNENDLWSFWDKEVWQKVSEFEGMLIPGLEI